MQILLTSPLKIGSGSNYLQVETDGSLRRYGTSTVFDDVVQSVNNSNLYDVAGKADYDFNNLWVVLQSGGVLTTLNDCLFVNYQIPHAAKPDSVFKLHFHWSQSNNNVRTISGKYRKQGQNGVGTSTAWTNFSMTTAYGTNPNQGNVFDTSSWNFGTGNFNQITRLVDIPLSDLGLSGIIQVVFTRTDAVAASDIYIYSVDGHIEKDDDGSRQEYVK